MTGYYLRDHINSDSVLLAGCVLGLRSLEEPYSMVSATLKGCHSSTFKTVCHTSSKHYQNTLSLQPNIKTYDKLELCIGTEYMLLKIRLCIVFKQQNFRTVHHFKSLGFLFVLKLKKGFSPLSLYCFNWTKDCQVSLILLSICQLSPADFIQPSTRYPP